MQRNLGREKIHEITSSEDWSCLVCDPKQIYKHKATYYSMYLRNKNDSLTKVSVKEKKHLFTKRKSDSLYRKADQILNSSHNFIEENIGKKYIFY